MRAKILWFRVTVKRSKGKLSLLIEWATNPVEGSELAALTSNIPSTGIII